MRIRSVLLSTLILMSLAGCAQSNSILGEAGDWPRYARDLAGTRYSPLSEINAENVSRLKEAWSFRVRPKGGGALVSWLLATGQEDALEPFTMAIHEMIEQVHREEMGADHPADREALESTLVVVLLALGQSLIGPPLSSALKLPDNVARDVAERFVSDPLEKAGRTTA